MIKNYRDQVKINFRLWYHIMLLKKLIQWEDITQKKCQEFSFEGNLPIFPYSTHWIGS